MTVTDDPSYDYREGIARHGREHELGEAMLLADMEIFAADVTPNLVGGGS